MKRKSKIKSIHHLTQFVLFISLVFLYKTNIHAAITDDSYAYTISPNLMNATYQYLDEIYIQKYPDFGLELTYGSDADRAVIQKLCNIITEGKSTDSQKADAIVKWVSGNIKYQSLLNNTYYMPIDVFYNRTGNCEGYSLLISQLMRMAGIRAVPCSGYQGDMVKTIKLGQLTKPNTIGHAWVMAYIDNQWKLYDPLMNVHACTDRTYISKWYYFDFIDGITPYCEGVPDKYLHFGYNVFYINNRFIYYVDGIPASQKFNMSARFGIAINNIGYFTHCRYQGADGTNDPFQYVDQPARRNSMINDECYSNGWLNSFGSLFYARKNGILRSHTITEHNGQTLYFVYDGNTLILPEKATNYTMYQGYISIQKGSIFQAFEPTWTQEALQNGQILVWESLTPELATIDSNGKITAKSEGLATLTVVSKDSLDSNTHYYSAFLQFYITDNLNRVADYTDHSLQQMKKPEKTTMLKFKYKKKGTVSLSWKKQSSVNGYQIQYATNKKFKKSKTKNTKKNSISISKLKKKKTYYFRVRAYQTDEKKKRLYGAWSITKKIKIKK